MTEFVKFPNTGDRAERRGIIVKAVYRKSHLSLELCQSVILLLRAAIAEESRDVAIFDFLA